jgi:hypothetical protein
VDLSAAADTLYALSPRDFTARRNELADQAKRDGDTSDAATIRGWRKPTVSAWLVNRLAAEQSEDLAALVDLGERLRSAQQSLDGAELRDLSRQRQQSMRDLLVQARQLAKTAGQAMSDSVDREIQATLQVALTDPDAALAVQTGHLATPLEAGGFGPVDITGALAVPLAPRPAALDVKAAQRDAEAVVRSVERRLLEARKALDVATARQEAQQERLAEREHTLAIARSDLESAQASAREAHQRHDRLEAELAEAQERLVAARPAGSTDA